MKLSHIITTLELFGTLAVAIPVSQASYFNKRDNTPVLSKNFPDPSIMQAGDGHWYSFATMGNGRRVQVAKAPEPAGPWTLLDNDPLPDAGNWTSSQNTWAPDVQRAENGQYVMYYAGQLSNETTHCIGAATSDDIVGPYTPSDTWFACDVSVGGSIDPSGFRDDDGRRYVAYKIDGNNVGHGGLCGNEVQPQVPTPIMLQEVDAGNGVTQIGDPVQILDRTDADGPLVEAPALVRTDRGRYVLFYSAGCFSSSTYDVKYATADNVRGPYTPADKPLLSTSGAANLTAPGGATPLPDGSGIMLHANCDEGRCLFGRTFKIDGDTIIMD
jgi:beta-xylosidase